MVSKVNRQGIRVVHCKNPNVAGRFQVGKVIPASGVYKVFHSDHQAQEVTLREGETFPPCHQCGNKTYFECLREVPVIDEDDYEFKVVLYEIPHPEKEKDRKKVA